MSDTEDPQRHRRGIPAARSNLFVARLAAERYLAEYEKEGSNKHDLMLYYGAFFFFARSALFALEKSDGRVSPELNALQTAYFRSDIQPDPVFKLLKDERDRICHGDDSWAFHPMMPMAMIDRFFDAGHDLSVALFDKVWPEEPFKAIAFTR